MKKNYESPCLDIYEVEIEKGIAQSQPQGGSIDGMTDEDANWD